MTTRSKPTLPIVKPQTGATNANAPALNMDALPHLLGYALRRAQMSVFSDFAATFDALDLKPAQFSVLVLIDANPGCKQSDAADALGIMQPNFVAMMDQLETRGLAIRAPAKADRRSYALELTDAGRIVLNEARHRVAKHEVRMRQRLLPHEAEQLLELLERVAESASPLP
jgi:DNA-binding MarR family transcriptional regulator